MATWRWRSGGRVWRTRSNATSATTASTSGACSCSTTGRRRWTLGAADPPGGVPAAVRRAREGDGACDRRRADGRRDGAALSDERDGRRASRGGGDVHDLLVL